MNFDDSDSKIAFAEAIAFITNAAGLKHQRTVMVTVYCSTNANAPRKIFNALVFAEESPGTPGARLEYGLSETSELHAFSILVMRLRRDLKTMVATHQDKIDAMHALIDPPTESSCLP